MKGQPTYKQILDSLGDLKPKDPEYYPKPIWTQGLSPIPSLGVSAREAGDALALLTRQLNGMRTIGDEMSEFEHNLRRIQLVSMPVEPTHILKTNAL